MVLVLAITCHHIMSVIAILTFISIIVGCRSHGLYQSYRNNQNIIIKCTMSLFPLSIQLDDLTIIIGVGKEKLAEHLKSNSMEAKKLLSSFLEMYDDFL